MRASMGYYFAYFAIVSRVIIAFFWFGIQVRLPFPANARAH